MRGAFAYLVATSSRNQVRAAIGRLRQPRYAIGLMLVAGYFWLAILRHSSRPIPEGHDFATTLADLLPLALFAGVVWSWLFGADRSSLAFSQAEVAMLFTAPIGRRSLILYKISRMQGRTLLTSVIWGIIFGRGVSGGIALAHAIGYWLALSTLSLHRLGIALVRASQSSHGMRGVRRRLLPVGVTLCVAVVIVAGFVMARGALEQGMRQGQLAESLAGVLRSSPIRWALLPFRLVLAPSFATSLAEWWPQVGIAVAVLVLHVGWVLHGDAAFEETAAQLSAERAARLGALRTRGATTVVPKASGTLRSLPLSPTGPRALALVWKNMLWLMRTGQVRALIATPIVLGALAVGCTRWPVVEAIVMSACVGLVGVIILFGGSAMRNDLRNELLNLEMLKTFPLTGGSIVLASVASSALVVASMQILIGAAGLYSFAMMPDGGLSTDMIVGVTIGAPLLLIGINAASFTIHNGLALLYPAWVRLGGTGAPGVEAMGLTMLNTFVTFFLLVCSLILPAAGGAVAFGLLRSAPGPAIASAGMVAGLLLAAEALGTIMLLGRSMDRLEPLAVER